ncbi:hypothetical protein MUK71_14965 [Arthrobacter zhangbolii]|uniref:Lipoprotein n=1 Tax=Arthrobacter zhangbolii TaxID=2886936 RepID=A0A9X1M6A7_9MICC|nr:hypothetical protein [Arthrobacter zhangbolii]MCC3272273.1 hypothetical protein [Arthrobacter zhangbolii]UON91861.1 hypothetical protein MUK71_14965 [Arthrobacter zhangbolii]
MAKLLSMLAMAGGTVLSGCQIDSAPMPPDGHVFLTVRVQPAGETESVQDCQVRLDPLFSTSPAPRAAAGISDAAGVVEFVQPHGNYQLFVECPGLEPADPTYLELDGNVAYADTQVLASQP